MSQQNNSPRRESLLTRFFREYSWKEAVIILVEPWLQILMGWIPGVTGFLIRSFAYRLILGRLQGMAYIAPAVTFQRSYGIHLGKNFAVNRGSLIDGKGGVQIGDNVLIGPYVVIASSQHAYDNPDLPIILHLEDRAPVHIGNDVWIGAHAVILPGVTIGERVIVGAGAIVTRDIESHSVAVGVPAKVIRKLP